MGAIQFDNNKILFDNSQIAFDEACCCDLPPVACGGCPDDLAPGALQLTISGFTDSTCDCSSIDGTYTLSPGQHDDLPPLGGCPYVADGPTLACSGPSIRDIILTVELAYSGVNLELLVTVWFLAGPETAHFAHFAAADDCLNFTRDAAFTFSTAIPCSGAPASITVTAL